MRTMFAGLMALGLALMGASSVLADGGLSAKPKPSAVSGVFQPHPAGHRAAPMKTAMGTKPSKAKKHRTSAQAAPKANFQPSHSGAAKPITNGK